MASEEGGGGGGGVVLCIGYALSPKKAESFITPSLLNLAKQRGILLLPIDLTKPLTIQQGGEGEGGGRFHCIIHKLSSPDWYDQLIEFSSKFPSVPIIDPPHAIQRLHDRVSMLQVVADLQIPPCSSCSFGIPNQVCVRDTSQLAGLLLLLLPPPPPPPSPEMESSKDLEFPVIAKPLVADGTPKSHQMSLVFNREGLDELEMEIPFVLQQFVNHGGVIFKVYVVGDYVKCVKRRSLPDITDGSPLLDNVNSMSFSQISNLAVADDSNDLDAMEMPPLSFLNYLANALRGVLKLHLFNFDVIRDVTKSPLDHYCIIDINYFPGYAKMPSYETVLTDFFLGILHQPNSSSSSSSFNAAAAAGGSCS